MKKILSILFLFLFLYQFIGYYLTFNLNRINYKNTETETSILKFSIAEYHKINWKKQNKEFIYHNNLYDIKSIKILNNKIIIKCVSDNKETSFFKKLNLFVDNFVASNSLSKNQKNNLKLIFFKSVFFNNTSAFHSLKKSSKISDYYFIALYKNIVKNIIPPPPKF